MEANVRTNRGVSPEEEYFRRLEAERLEERRLEAERALAASQLASALDRANSEHMQRLLAVGLTAETAAAFRLLPLVEVAWADGSVDGVERTRILERARRLGLKPGESAHDLLESWLEVEPDPSLFRIWHELASEDRMRGVSRDERWRLLEDAEAVASASGGMLGLAAISRDERRVLSEVQASLGGSAAPPAA